MLLVVVELEAVGHGRVLQPVAPDVAEPGGQPGPHPQVVEGAPRHDDDEGGRERAQLVEHLGGVL